MMGVEVEKRKMIREERESEEGENRRKAEGREEREEREGEQRGGENGQIKRRRERQKEEGEGYEGWKMRERERRRETGIHTDIPYFRARSGTLFLPQRPAFTESLHVITTIATYM